MADFKSAFNKTRKWEKGYSNNPNDNGGATMNGVTLKTFQFYYGKEKTVEDLKKITLSQEMEIAKELYWDKIGGDEINDQSVAEILYDYSFNSGVKTAVKAVQRIVKVGVDGISGQKTLGAINHYWSQKELFRHLWNVRKDFYDKIIRNNNKLECFRKGWMNRLNSFTYSK